MEHLKLNGKKTKYPYSPDKTTRLQTVGEVKLNATLNAIFTPQNNTTLSGTEINYTYAADKTLIGYGGKTLTGTCDAGGRPFLSLKTETYRIIIQSLYEDKVEGKISEERFYKLSKTYADEQAEHEKQIGLLGQKLSKSKDEEESIAKFMRTIQRYTDITEQTAEILR